MQANSTSKLPNSQKRKSSQESFLTLPALGFVRLKSVLHHIPICKSAWWAGVKDGRYPKPVKLGPNTTAWRVEDIHTLIEEMNERSMRQQ